MATVKKKRIKWTPASDPDIVAHWVFVVPEGQAIDPALTPYVQVDMPMAEILAPDDFPSDTFAGDQNYEVGICAVDDVGNLSDLTVVPSPFDFIAPGAPTNIIVENI
ncbi:MAG: hypothetical protein ACFFCW_00430 [Candidatus Hodarchaeota archaeon]